jgi:drug/metabolite transporter (DMT)-like permease
MSGARPLLSRATLAGIAAVLIWASCISVARLATESLGVFTSAAAIFLLAGIVATAVRAMRPGAFASALAHPRRYLLGCGALFVACQIGLYGGLGLAVDRPQVLEIAAVNYLWPAMTLAFALPILGHRARPSLLALGSVLALAGIVAATMDPAALSLRSTICRVASHPVPYVLAFGGAASWAVYSNLARKYAQDAASDAVPLFLLASGVALLAVRLSVHEHSVISLRAAGALAYAALLPAYGGYALWDIGVRRGDFTLLSALSYLIPVLSTLISCVVLRVRPSASLWAGVVMVTVGAVVCRLAFGRGREHATAE